MPSWHLVMKGLQHYINAQSTSMASLLTSFRYSRSGRTVNEFEPGYRVQVVNWKQTSTPHANSVASVGLAKPTGIS
jgi:hypothetical protein